MRAVGVERQPHCLWFTRAVVLSVFLDGRGNVTLKLVRNAALWLDPDPAASDSLPGGGQGHLCVLYQAGKFEKLCTGGRAAQGSL